MPAAWFHALAKRYNRLIVYGLVGSALAVLQMALTAGFTKTVVADPSVASVIASLITIPIAFWAHRNTTYADIAREPAQAARFVLTACSSIAIAALVIKIVCTSGGPLWLALFLGSALVPVGNYVVNAIWVFRTKHFFALDRTP